MKFLTCATLFFQLSITAIPVTSQATTLAVFHNPSDGVILATDSAVGMVRGDEIKSGRAIPTSVKTECKMETCGRYFVAEAGFGGLISKSGKSAIATRCSQLADRPANIQEFVTGYRRLVADEITQYVSGLVRNKQEPAVNDVLLSTAIAGYEFGSPVLRYFDNIFTGIKGNQLTFRVARKDCPSGAECGDLQIVAGEKDAILARQQYRNTADKLLFAEELLQIEIEANRKTRYVLPPVSIVQIKNVKPRWFRRGLCT